MKTKTQNNDLGGRIPLINMPDAFAKDLRRKAKGTRKCFQYSISQGFSLGDWV